MNAWNGGWLPGPGSGKHVHVNGGAGLANSEELGTYEPGWAASYDSNISLTNDSLSCGQTPTWGTWTSSAGGNEDLPITCVNWEAAYAFCIWDGGFLPSEAEWEYAAAGGSQQREYPWGSADPGTANQYAIYECYYPIGFGPCGDSGGIANIAPVGTAPMGAGLWGQLDLAGDGWELVLDSVSTDLECALHHAVHGLRRFDRAVRPATRARYSRVAGGHGLQPIGPASLGSHADAWGHGQPQWPGLRLPLRSYALRDQAEPIAIHKQPLPHLMLDRAATSHDRTAYLPIRSLR